MSANKTQAHEELYYVLYQPFLLIRRSLEKFFVLITADKTAIAVRLHQLENVILRNNKVY